MDVIYRFEGVVSAGRRLGRKLGFPTANIPMPESVQVRDGVYAAVVVVDGVRYRAMVNAGHRPSVEDGGGRILEAHLFGFSGDLYGKTIEVELIRFMREEEKFDTLEELQERIESDRREILKIFNNAVGN